MLDFSWSELLLCLIVAVFAIGPKQLPDLLYQAGRGLRRLQYLRYALTRQVDEFMMLGDIKELQNTAPITPTSPPSTAIAVKDNEAEADDLIEAELDIDPDYLPPESDLTELETFEPDAAQDKAEKP